MHEGNSPFFLTSLAILDKPWGGGRGGVDLCLNGSHGVMYGLMSFAYTIIIVICKKTSE